MNTTKITWPEFLQHTDIFLRRLIDNGVIVESTKGYRNHFQLYGIPNGGNHVAHALACRHPSLIMVEGPPLAQAPIGLAPGVIVVDDIIDSGRTAEPFEKGGFPVYALYCTPNTPDHLKRHAVEMPGGWLQFPWENPNQSGPEEHIVRLLQYIGEDATREGLLKTPTRVLKAFKEMTVGYHQDPAEILSTVFNDACDEMVILRDIPFHSLCEHHLLPFSGKAHVGYIPDGKVVGLSKLARLVHCFARRLQVQERLTKQIAEAMDQHLKPLGSAVLIEAQHLCMTCRGVGVHDSKMVTSALKGAMCDASSRNEFLSLCRSS